MPKIDGTGVVLDFLKGLPAKQAAQISRKVLELGKNPNPADSEKLIGHPYFRADTGEYRIIYEYLEEIDTINIILVGKRNDDEIYRILKRRQS